jgi:hypothetical protein
MEEEGKETKKQEDYNVMETEKKKRSIMKRMGNKKTIMKKRRLLRNASYLKGTSK